MRKNLLKSKKKFKAQFVCHECWSQITINEVEYQTAYLTEPYAITLNNKNATTPGTETIYLVYNKPFAVSSNILKIAISRCCFLPLFRQ